jgi:hypothetical protein
MLKSLIGWILYQKLIIHDQYDFLNSNSFTYSSIGLSKNYFDHCEISIAYMLTSWVFFNDILHTKKNFTNYMVIFGILMSKTILYIFQYFRIKISVNEIKNQMIHGKVYTFQLQQFIFDSKWILIWKWNLKRQQKGFAESLSF